ncbi:MAG: hypothetical protein NTU97_01650 [Candidatus Magasanikbacteria bacterium]|nr:hypothetical protein [Candidatus Magasanikbacteria bacterium]
MTLRTKIFFYGGIIILFIVGLILALIFRSKTPAPVNTPVNNAVNAPVNGALPGNNQPITTVVPEKKVTPEEVKVANTELTIKNVSKNFAERFGSYSLEANFSNFTEVMDLVTPTVAAWLKTYPTDLLKKLPEGFEGVSTMVLSQQIESSTVSQANLLVSTQREETVKGQTRLYYQDMKVNLVLKGDKWLVDGAYWQ